MPELDQAALRTQIKEDKLLPLYLLYGEESYLTSHYASLIVKKALGKQFNDFNYSRFAGKSLNVDELADAAYLLPLMQERKCVEVNDLDLDAMPAGELEKLKELVSDPPESCVMVFWQSAVQPSFTKSAKWKAFRQLLLKRGGLVKFARMDEASLARLLCDGAAKRGCRMHTTTARHMVETCGDDMNRLLSELDKLCAYRMEQEISSQDVDLLTVKTLDSTAFDLVRAINRGNADRAFGLLNELFDQKLEPLMILGALSSSYVDMYRAKCASISQVPPQQLAQKLGYKNKDRLRYAMADASRMEMKQLRHCLDILLEADTKLKSQRTDPRLVLEQAIMLLFAEAKRP